MSPWQRDCASDLLFHPLRFYLEHRRPTLSRPILPPPAVRRQVRNTLLFIRFNNKWPIGEMDQVLKISIFKTLIRVPFVDADI